MKIAFKKLQIKNGKIKKKQKKKKKKDKVAIEEQI